MKIQEARPMLRAMAHSERCDAEQREALALALDGWDRKLDAAELARRRTLMQRALGIRGEGLVTQDGGGR